VLRAGLFLLSFGGVLFEIAVVRLASVLLHSSLTPLVVAACLAALGLGAALAARGRISPEGAATAAVAGGLVGLLACVATPVGFALGLFALPFLGIGAFAGQAYTRAGATALTYTADVSGGALGALFAAPLLRSLGDVDAALLALAAAGAARALVGPGAGRLVGILPVLVLGLNALGPVLAVDPYAVRGFVPHLVLQTRERGGRVVETAWQGFARTDLVVTDDPGIRYLFTDRMYTARIARWDGRSAGFDDPQLAELSRLKGLAFRALRPERVLVLGAGGGFDVALALQSGARQVDAVEINAAMIRMTREQGAFAGHVYDRPEVTVHHAEARRLVREATGAWDLVNLALLETDPGLDRGNTGIQSWIFTAEAVDEYLQRLAPQGVLAIVQNTREVAEKTLATLVAGYERRGLGATEAGRRLAVVALPDEGRNPFAWLLVAGREPLAAGALGALRREAHDAAAVVVYASGTRGADPRIGALLAGTSSLDAWVEDSRFRLAPATDERPFFFDVHRGRPLLPLLAGFSAALLLALIFARDRASAPTPIGLRGLLTAVFTGAGFLMAQAALLARAQFLIGYPTLATAAVIGGMLSTAGLASAALGQRIPAAARLRMGGGSAGAALVALALAWPLLRDAVRGLDSAGLVWVALLLAALVGAPAGVAFPAGLQLFARAEAAGVFYGANAMAAVLGGAAAALLAPALGLSSPLVAAAMCYFAAAAMARAPARSRLDAVEPGLRRHLPADLQEAADLARILDFIGRHAAPYDRKIPEGHLTGAALIVSAAGDRVLLLHHRKLGRWLQPGGHGEAGETSGAEVALREALEETGIHGLGLHATAPRPLDVDIHPIPPRGDEPPHEHLDLRFLVVAPAGAQARLNADESHAIRWFGWDELQELDLDPGLLRALGKARKIVGGRPAPVQEPRDG